MKNFLILVLASGLAGSAFLTRPDREEFDAYIRHRDQATTGAGSGTSFGGVFAKSPSASHTPAVDAVDAGKLEFKDYHLWTVVRDKDGKALFTGVFDHWLDN